MDEEEELMKLREEVAKLKSEKMRLMQVKEAKLERLKAKLGNLYPSFAARHPLLTTIGSGLAKGAYQVGQNVNANVTPYNKAVNPAGLEKFVAKKRRRTSESPMAKWSEAYA
jgi:hypothetical protein